MFECPSCGFVDSKEVCEIKENGDVVCPKCDSCMEKMTVKIKRIPITLMKEAAE